MATRIVRVGGKSRDELLTGLRNQGIELNDLARALIGHPAFATSADVSEVAVEELSVAEFGFPEGATFDELWKRAASRGLRLCPLELGPYLRLQYRDQPEGQSGLPAARHQAPPGSLTVASPPVASPTMAGDETLPIGFYLRRIAGVLWLRGYRAAPEHVWSPDDRFVFQSLDRCEIPKTS